MQSMKFTASLVLLQGLILDAALVGEAMNKIDQEKSDLIKEEAGKAFLMLERSMKAFFKSKDEKYKELKLSSTLDVHKKKNGGVKKDKEVALGFLSEVSHKISNELVNHRGPKVFHTNGTRWVKTKADQDRFDAIATSAENLLALSK